LAKASINIQKCIKCDACRRHCRFDAIAINQDGNYQIDINACEGCAVCSFVCPVQAITLQRFVDGRLELYNGEESVFSTAQLKMGSGTSGLLVSEVKKQLAPFKDNIPIAIIDGSPGIGCPVIASISGVDMVLVVAEPSLSGLSDMKRIIATARKFHTPLAVCVNRFDTNETIAKQIKQFALEQEIPFLTQIPFDEKVIAAVNDGLTIVDVDCRAGDAVRYVFEETIKLLNSL
jgi:MinD superfamily P-loop ATPase